MATMDYERATRHRARTRHPGEDAQHTGKIKLEMMPGLVEEWDWMATRWSDRDGLEGGRVLLGDMDDVDASLNWTTLTGQPVIYQAWVADDLRRLGVARKLVAIYRELVSPHVVMAGPFSPEGRRLAEAVADKILEDEVEPSPSLTRKIKRKLLQS